MKRTLPMIALATLFATAPLFAQQTQPTEKPKEGSVNDRREDQQQRIANGVQSGQLTAGETKRLESREANLNHEIKTDRQANGGKLTPQERQHVNRRQNDLSDAIYNDKHNAAQTHYGNTEVGQRRENQQQPDTVLHASKTPEWLQALTGDAELRRLSVTALQTARWHRRCIVSRRWCFRSRS